MTRNLNWGFGALLHIDALGKIHGITTSAIRWVLSSPNFSQICCKVARYGYDCSIPHVCLFLKSAEPICFLILRTEIVW